MDTITPHKGGRTARLDMRVNPHIKAKLEILAQQAGMSTADLIEYWTQQATATARIPHEIRILNERGETRPVFKVRPNGAGHPRWTRRYSVIRYDESDAAGHVFETDSLHEAVAVCEAAADAYIQEIEDIGLAGYQKTYGADTDGVRNARQNQDTK